MWVYQVLFSAFSGFELSGLASGRLVQPGLCPCMGGSHRLRRNTRGALKFDIYLFTYCAVPTITTYSTGGHRSDARVRIPYWYLGMGTYLTILCLYLRNQHPFPLIFDSVLGSTVILKPGSILNEN